MGQKILIIDDNKGDMKLIADHFEDAGLDYKILWAETGEQGLDIAKKESPEVIFLDTFLPKLNGFEVCEQLKNAGNSAYVIMMSGTLQDFDKLESKNLLADGFCGKKPDQILREMLRYLQQKTKENAADKKIGILLVEDNKGDQVLFREAIKETGINCDLTVIDRADQIVFYVEEIKPQIIFMDVMMAGITGGDAVKLLSQNPNTKGVPVVFLTGIFGLADELKQHKGINVDGQNYPSISKPIEVVRLTNIIKKYI